MYVDIEVYTYDYLYVLAVRLAMHMIAVLLPILRGISKGYGRTPYIE